MAIVFHTEGEAIPAGEVDLVPGAVKVYLICLLVILVSVGGGMFYFLTGNVCSISREFRSQVDIKGITIQLATYQMTMHRLPSSEEGLDALVNKPGKGEEYRRWRQLKTKDNLLDGWDRPYRYRVPAIRSHDSYDLFSVGADGLADTADDIGNWGPNWRWEPFRIK